MKCPNPLCSQPVVIDQGDVGWCAARHRVGAYPLALGRLEHNISRAMRQMYDALRPTVEQAVRAFADFGRAFEKMKEVASR